jgi:hypothetical protein
MVSCHRLLTAALPAVCRRWGSKPGLIWQALTGAAGTQLQVPDVGSVDTGLRMLARAVQVMLSAQQVAAITTALIVGGLSAPEIAGVMRQFWTKRDADPGAAAALAAARVGIFSTPPDSAG